MKKKDDELAPLSHEIMLDLWETFLELARAISEGKITKAHDAHVLKLAQAFPLLIAQAGEFLVYLEREQAKKNEHPEEKTN